MLVGRCRSRCTRQQHEQGDAQGQSVGKARVDARAVFGEYPSRFRRWQSANGRIETGVEVRECQLTVADLEHRNSLVVRSRARWTVAGRIKLWQSAVFVTTRHSLWCARRCTPCRPVRLATCTTDSIPTSFRLGNLSIRENIDRI